MDKKRLLDMSSQRGVRVTASEINQKTIEWVVNDCRKYIQERSDQYRNMEVEERRAKIKNLIVSYAMDNKYLVEGYVDDSGKTDTLKLVDKLVDSIQNYDFLTDAINDPTINEIRGNGRELKVERQGRCVDLTDSNGNVLMFESPEQQATILSKFLGDVRISRKDAVINARTMEGYRIAAVHSSATADDPSAPTADKYDIFVLRKFNKKKMDLSDIVRNRTMSDNMARFLSLMMEGGLTFFTAGPTASGKSTTNNAILQYAPLDTRVVLLQNPSEIDLRFKDETGRTYNDVIHLEYIEKENPGPHDPTSINLMDQILRLSPTFVAFGEWRNPREFKQGIMIAQAGHPINCTLHAENSEGVISRVVTAYLSESGNEPAELALQDIVSVTNIIIVQKIMRDGTRKVLQVTEVIGVDPTNPHKPLLNDLFIFKADGEPIYDKSGKVKEIPGHHVRVGKLSDRTINKLRIEGVAMSRVDFMLEDPKPSEREEYTGENIRHYGMEGLMR